MPSLPSLLLGALLPLAGLIHPTTARAPHVRAVHSRLSRRAQPLKSGVPGTFEEVGSSGVSAQQIFLGSANKVYILDKTENNPLTVGDHAAWATEYTLDNNAIRAMDVRTNTFCAGGNVLGNGTWINVGGNQPVTWGGATVTPTTDDPYQDQDGGSSIRLLDPCDDNTSCNWYDDLSLQMTTKRWYPTLETLEDGRVAIIGGDQFGGYVNDNATVDNPTYEIWPTLDGSPVVPTTIEILTTTRPANLFPLTWLLPSGNLFIQAGWKASILDYKTDKETPVDNVPDAVRCYPASGASALLPLTPTNNYTATVLFCGGTDLNDDQWVVNWPISQYPASNSCVTITPDVSGTWNHVDNLPDSGRTMGNFIILPDGKILLLNGAKLGTAGYGNDSWAIGHSYADSPLQTPLIYDPDAALTQQWNTTGLSSSPIPRLYHSTATLLPDGSVLVSGSNPNPDYVAAAPTVKYPTEYRTERFYPWYYSATRPEPQGLPTTLGYGGDWFNVTVDTSSLGVTNPATADYKVIVMRFGFSTHAINFGQRYLQLNSTVSVEGAVATLHVAQMPPNAAIFAPGPAWMSTVVNGVPAVFSPVMIGNGILGQQDVSSVVPLPDLVSEAPVTPSTTPSGKSSALPAIVIPSTISSVLILLGTVLVTAAHL